MTFFPKEKADGKKEMDIYPNLPTTSLHVMYADIVEAHLAIPKYDHYLQSIQRGGSKLLI